ncbi:MAG TPA: hypothetical protein RMH85_06425 [Polyangiaceae bacterium LLY-WYZ-15_(1-7)]|nr:hypothetical protein [Sandaracinus sp.]HJL03109.1 hypothetical protein [Polyangiaceae bacterium LLY-WYZ-15_(1-7)]MBJ70211.1 hypothetical protein [Sandaracinus sp.]HJL08111.1 hypothetical protein [Polyangiaceae bacterium LLY-WYZ-15_(1-7)]HJL24021.1 hypothetical protein [Polyangiaceae bacterium LLY-WYZ-15_(1-7)]
MKVDGTELEAVLALAGVAPVAEDTDELKALEAAIGQRLPEESRAFLRARPTLEHPDAEGHPEIDGHPFACGLPDVDAFLSALGQGLLGRYLACCHFVGLYPVGVRLGYGDFMWPMLVLEEHAPGVGGVMYYDERELGTWAPTCSAFLLHELGELWEQIDGELDGMDPEEKAEAEVDPAELRDCFAIEGFDWRAHAERPAGEPLPEALAASWGAHWRPRMGMLSRSWLAGFVGGGVQRWQLDALPTPAEWEAAKATVGERYGDAMYWLLAHAALDNGPELAECLARTEAHPGAFVQAMREAVAGGALAPRFAEAREALYALARAAG